MIIIIINNTNIDYRERGSHAQGVYLTQDTSRMDAAKMKQEEVADTRIITKKKRTQSKKSGRKEREHEGEEYQTRPN